jgi:hypothetical protein
MTQPRFWKNLPAPLRLLLRPWVIVSVGLHVLFLLMPLPDRSSSELPISEEPIQITELPASTPPAAPPPLPVPSPTAPAPAPQSTPAMPAPRSDAPPAASTPLSPPPSPTPNPPPVPQQAAPDPGDLDHSDQSNQSDQSDDSSLPPDAMPDPDPTATSLVEDFPHGAVGGEPGCGGQENCWQTGDSDWRSVARALERELTSEGYSVKSQTDEEILRYRVYEISKNGEVEYLNLLADIDGNGTFYVLADQPMSREELEQLTETSGS